MDNLCQICKQEIKADNHFWKEHRTKMSDYYAKFYPRFDLLTQEPIPFKSKEQYFTGFFINRTNLGEFLRKLEVPAQREFSQMLLKNRIEIKKIKYAPTQVELRTLILPTIVTYKKIFGDYSSFCKSLGLICKFADFEEIEPISYHRPTHIQIDTREQIPLKLSIPVQIGKLDFGDYALSDPALNDFIFIERKNHMDFISTLSSGYERFQEEIKRALDKQSFLIIVVDGMLSKLINFNYSTYVKKFVKASPDFIFHRVRELLQTYPNIQFAFVDGPSKAAILVEKILMGGKIYRNIDIQYGLDKGIITL